MSGNTFSTRNFYLAAYLLTVTDADLPEIVDGKFVFKDEDGQVGWAAQAFSQDKAVQRFCNSLKRLKNIRKEFDRKPENGGMTLQEKLHKALTRADSRDWRE
jgi:hypothetical protein